MDTKLLQDMQENAKEAFEYFDKVIQTYDKVKSEIENEDALKDVLKDDLKDASFGLLIETVQRAKSFAGFVYVRTDTMLAKIKKIN